MTIMFGILLVTWTLCYTCLAIPDVHKRMTANQLQSIFHVDNINSVPHYELIKLLHHGISGNDDSTSNSRSNRSIRRKRSINNQMNIESKNIHHIKKDLSKTPYFSDIKNLSEQNSVNSISDLSDSFKIKNLDLSDIKEHNVSFSAFGELLNLTLKQTDGLFKNGPESLRMWMVRSEPNSTQGLEYDEIEESPANQDKEEIGEVFQDEDNMAAILMRRQLQTGDLIMEGSIGHELVIKPLPHELSPNKEEVHHIIYKRSVDEATESLSDFAYMEPDRLEKRYREKRSSSQFDTSKTKWTERDEDDDLIASSSKINHRSKRAAPYIIYPEILVIVDYDGYRLHGGDNVQVKRYFVSFWNGVDLRYRLLKGPRIRISIAGIIISRGRDATPYLERNRVGRDAIDSAAALTDMGKYLFRERRLPVYDIAVAITKLDMCRRNYPYGECKRGTAGFAYVGGACVVNKRLEKVNSVAIIEDTGGFSGIIVAAHEVGHLLGAVHDGSPPPSYLGGPGAQKCRWEDGYIMSDLRHTERGFRWSPCTIQSFHHFLNGDTASCLHNAPHEDSALGRALPGTLLSLDAQCRRDRGTYACFKDDRVCAQLFCFDSQTGYCVAYRPAAEGSSCGSGVHCLDGRCVAAHTAAYTQHVYRQAYNIEDEDENEDDEEDEEEDDDEEDDDDDYNESTPPKSLNTPPTYSSSTTPPTITTKLLPIIAITSTTTTPTTPAPTIIVTATNTTIVSTTNTPIIHSTQTILQIHENIPTTTIKTTKLLTTKHPTNLNPFYYGISKLKSQLEQHQQHNTNNTTTLTTINLNNRNRNISNKQLSLKPIIRKPFDYYLNLYNIKYRNSHSSNSPYYSSSTTIATTTTTQQTPIISTTTAGTTITNKLHEIDGNYDNINDDNVNNNNNDDNDGDDDPDFGLKFNNNNNPSTTQRSYIFGGRSTTRSSFFESYFRKLTTKNPNYDNFGKYFRRINISSSSSSSSSSSNSNNNNNNNNDNNNHSSVGQQHQHLPATAPSYSSNYLGDNSNYLPVNVSVTERYK